MTELIWEGKEDKDGKRAVQRDLWAQGQPDEWRNRLVVITHKKRGGVPRETPPALANG